MTGILKQWKIYLRWIHYKFFIKGKVRNIKNQVNKLTNEKTKYEKQLKDLELFNKTYLGTFKHLQNPNKSKRIYLVGKEIFKLRFFEKIKRMWFSFLDFDGYILYFNKANVMKIFKVRNLHYLYKVKDKAFALHDKVGSFKGKPIFMIKEPLPISLNIKDNGECFYDYKSFFNYVDKLTKINATDIPNQEGLGQFLKKNLITVGFLILLAFIFFTQEGQQILSGLGG